MIAREASPPGPKYLVSGPLQNEPNHNALCHIVNPGPLSLFSLTAVLVRFRFVPEAHRH